MLGYILLGLAALAALLLLAAAVNAARMKAKPAAGKPAISWTQEEAALDAERLSAMIRVQTLSK